MTATRFAASALILIMLSGCASTITAYTNKPISTDHLDEPDELNKLKTLSGDRRLVRVQRADQPGPVWIICAETQADAIAARGARSGLSVVNQGSVNDATDETLVVTNDRSSVSDVVRQLSWQLCNAYMNGVMTESEYRTALEDLSENAMRVLIAQGAPGDRPSTVRSISPATATVGDNETGAAAKPICVPAEGHPCVGQ